MPVILMEICKNRSCTQENRLVEAVSDTVMSNIGTNRKANCAVLRDTDTEDYNFCGKLNLSPFPRLKK